MASNFEDAAARYFQDTEKREREADRRHRELVEVHQRGYADITRALADGFKLVHDAIVTAAR
jgi:uncharacterized lipoprotein YmbA